MAGYVIFEPDPDNLGVVHIAIEGRGRVGALTFKLAENPHGKTVAVWRVDLPGGFGHADPETPLGHLHLLSGTEYTSLGHAKRSVRRRIENYMLRNKPFDLRGVGALSGKDGLKNW